MSSPGRPKKTCAPPWGAASRFCERGGPLFVSWADADDLVGPWRVHAEPVAGDLLDARMGGPGALFELELAPFDFECAHAFLFALELGDELAGAMVGRYYGEGADQHGSEHEKVEADHVRFFQPRASPRCVPSGWQ